MANEVESLDTATLKTRLRACVERSRSRSESVVLRISNPELIPAWYGVSLPGVYLAWAFVVAVMYVPCRWYAGLKARRNDWWIRYT